MLICGLQLLTLLKFDIGEGREEGKISSEKSTDVLKQTSGIFA